MMVTFVSVEPTMRKRQEVVNIAVAKARLPELVERAASGEEIVLARNGKPRARLTALVERKKFVYGSGKGKWKGTERVLDRPLPQEFIDVFYGIPSESPARKRR
jgi:prevent-host-death family protein